MSNGLRKASDFVPPKRQSPAQRMIDELDGNFWRIKQAAPLVGVSEETLRRLLATDKVKAPSDVLVRGDMHMWLLTEADLVEVARYFNATRTLEERLRAQTDGELPPIVDQLLKEHE